MKQSSEPEPDYGEIIDAAVHGWRLGIYEAHPGCQIREAQRIADGVNRYVAIATFPSLGVVVGVATAEFEVATRKLRIVTDHLMGPRRADELPEPLRSLALASGSGMVRTPALSDGDGDGDDWRVQEGGDE